MSYESEGKELIEKYVKITDDILVKERKNRRGLDGECFQKMQEAGKKYCQELKALKLKYGIQL